MALKRYEVTVPNRRGNTTTTMQLSDEDAKRLGVFEQSAAGPRPPAKRAGGKTPAKRTSGKSRAPRNKAGKPDEDKAQTETPAVEDASDPDASE